MGMLATDVNNKKKPETIIKLFLALITNQFSYHLKMYWTKLTL